MKRKTFTHLIFALALLSLTLWSCDTLFVNQFAELGLGQVDVEEVKTAITDAVANADPVAIIQQSGIQESGVTDTFVKAVVESGQTDEVIDVLKTVITDVGTTLEEKEAAAVVIVEILIEETGETDLLQNMIVAAASFDFTGFDINNPADLDRLLAALLPEGAKSITYPEGWDGARLAGLLDALNEMGDDFEALAGIIADNQGELTNLNLDAGWYAQVGTLVRVLNALELQPTNPAAPPVGTVDTVGKAIVYILENENPQTNVELMFGDVSTIIDELSTDTVLINLFSAAGLDIQAILDMVG
ncbi:MAG: hypothetical protein AB1407_08180 [Spirochaetota bacterium]